LEATLDVRAGSLVRALGRPVYRRQMEPALDLLVQFVE
jgi:hypothetical protein